MFSFAVLSFIALASQASCHGHNHQHAQRMKCLRSEIQKDSQTNFIKNGDFENPQINGWKIIDIPNWEGHVQIGKGFIYNARWGNSQVIEMDSDRNYEIIQNIELPDDDNEQYLLKFQYAARTNKVDTSGVKVFWNNLLIANIRGQDDEIHDVAIHVKKNFGLNQLRLLGSGNSDSFGMTMDNFVLQVDDAY